MEYLYFGWLDRIGQVRLAQVRLGMRYRGSMEEQSYGEGEMKECLKAREKIGGGGSG